MRFSDLRIGTQLLLFMGLALASAVVLAGWSWLQTRELWEQARGLHDHPLRVQRALGRFEVDVLELHRHTTELCAAPEGSDATEHLREIALHRANAERQLAILHGNYLGPSQDVETLRQEFVRGNVLRDETLGLLKQGKRAEATARTRANGPATKQLTATRRRLRAISDFADKRAKRYYSDALQRRERLRYELGILVAATLGLGLALFWLVLLGVRAPLVELTRTASRFRDGDLSARVAHASRNEVGNLAATFNAMAEAMQTQARVAERAAKVNKLLLHESALRPFCDRLVASLLEHTQSQVGALYLLDEAAGTYRCLSSIGLSVAGRREFSADELEGELGAVVATQQIQHLSALQPDTVFTFKAVVGDLAPRELVAMPVVNESRVVAVVALASVRPYAPEQLRLLHDMRTVITTRVNGVLAHERIRELALRLEQQNQELERQKQELTKQAEALSAQNAELAVQQQKLHDADRMKNAFMANMSHELRTPLNSVIALSGVLRRRLGEKIPQEESGYLEVIERNGRALLELINDILDLARIEAGRERVEIGLVALPDLVREITAQLEVSAEQKTLTLANRVPDDLRSIETDAAKCRHILQNLVANAIKFTERGEVVISAEQSPKDVSIVVEDTGIGIPPEHLDAIFEEFAQVDASISRRYGGTGLGLAIARRYARLLGGEITARSTPGKGSAFTLRIPLRPPDSQGKQTRALGQTPRRAGLQRRARGEIVLVVEDDPGASAQLRDLLQSHGYRVETARNGREALEKLRTLVPAAAILDLTMPEMDGLELLASMRAMEQTARLPVLILTARHIETHELESLRGNHVYELIRKGDIDADGLLSAVAGMTANASGPDAARERGLLALVVEDNPDNLRTARALLEPRYTVIEAVTGQEAIAQTRRYRPDVILMDIGLPDMNGGEALRRIREDAKLRTIPIVAVTASAMAGDRETILAQGFNAYTSKPIEHDALHELLNDLLRRGADGT